MGSEISALSQNSQGQFKRKNLKSYETDDNCFCQNQPQVPPEGEENKKLKNFLDVDFRSRKCATKKIEFELKQSSINLNQNSMIQKQFSLIKLEEYQQLNTIDKTDIVMQKTDSLLFDSIQNSEKFQYSSQKQTQKENRQPNDLRKTRASYASYDSNYKRLNIKQSNFVKIRNKDFQVSYQLLQKIGQGATGTVFKTRCRKTNDIRAVKIMKTKILKKLNETQKLHSELNILRNLDHPNIIKVYDVFFTEEYYYVVTQYCSGGTLLEYIIKNSTIDENLVMIIIKQLLGALTFIHNNSIIHRDIKLENIVFDINPKDCASFDEVQIKLIDFGLAMKAKFRSINKDEAFLGTPLYMAPEVLKGNYSDKCDVWSCGVIMHYLLFRDFPYASVDIPSLYLKISTQQLDVSRPYWKNASENSKHLLLSLLQRNSLKRATAMEALGYEWLMEAFDNSLKTEKDMVLRKLQEYKKENNFIRLIQSYLVFLKSSNKEQRKLITLFHKFDKNNNGVIDLQELSEMFSGKPDSEQCYLKQMLLKIDKNNSGKIQISEFLTFLTDRSKLFTEENLLDAFEFLDQNKNGYIDKKQLKKALEGCDIEEYKILWRDMDTNDDQHISKEEFIEYLLRMEEVSAR